MFELTFDRLMGHEGGYVNDPLDPGGETNWGISKRSYPNEDIKGMTRERAKVLFKRDFWDAVGADRLPPSVAFQLADFAYNSGPTTAIRAFQRALGVADDGHFGAASAAALARTPESDQVMRLNAERLFFMTGLKNWPVAGKGWARRIAQNLRYGAIDA